MPTLPPSRVDPLDSLKGPDAKSHGVWKKIRLVVLGWLALFGLIQFGPTFPATFERSGAWWLWPFGWGMCVLLFVLHGFLAHWRFGDAIHIPRWRAGICVSLLLGTFWFLTVQWTADRGIAWLIGLFATLAGCSLLFAVEAVSYGEVWRRRLNRAVVEQVWCVMHRAATPPQNNSADPNAKRKVKTHRVFDDRWGSRHCLQILWVAYRMQLARLVFVKPSSHRKESTRLCLLANMLLDYTNIRWSDEQLPPSIRRLLIRQILCELITATVVAYFRQLQQVTDANARMQSSLPGQIDAWISMLETCRDSSGSVNPLPHEQADAEALNVFLASVRLLMAMGRDLAMQSSCVLPLSQQSLYTSQFQLLIQNSKSPNLDRGTIAEIPALVYCCRLWLVAASPLDENLRIDSWLELLSTRTISDEFGPEGAAAQQASENQVLRFEIENPSSWDLLTCLTVVFLSRAYHTWSQRNPRIWNRSLERARARFTGLRNSLKQSWDQCGFSPEDKLPAVPETLVEKTQALPSWPYRQVWKTPGVRRFVRRRFCTVLVPCMVLVSLVSPLLCPWSWNTVDHVADPRWQADYTQTQSSVASIGSEAVVIGSEQGSTVIRLNGRGIHEGITSDAVLDLTRTSERDIFLALERNQAVTRILANRPEVRAETYLPAPEHPVWLGPQPTNSPECRAAAWDDSGVVVALKDIGIGRSPHQLREDGQMIRSRSWIAVNIPGLQDAVISRNSVWTLARIPFDGAADQPVFRIRQFDRFSLEEISQQEFSEDIRHFDVDAQSDAACAVEVGGSLWLKSPDSTVWHQVQAPQQQSHLQSANDVKIVRWSDPVALLGTSYGLFASDLLHRRMVPMLVGKPVTEILLVKAKPRVNAEDSSNSAQQPPANAKRFVIVAGGKLCRLTWTAEKGFEIPEELDENPVADVDITPDGKFCVYRLAGNQTSGHIRAMNPQESNPTPQTILQANGWNAPEMANSPPEIREIHRNGNRVRVLTQRGMFEINLDSHTYSDLSNGLYREQPKAPVQGDWPPGIARTLRLSDFSSLYSSGSDVAVIGDNYPLIWDEGLRSWVVLGVQPLEPLRQVVVCRPDSARWMFARTAAGELMRYDATHSFIQQPERFCMLEESRGSSNPLPTRTPQEKLLGDILEQSNKPGFRAAFVRNNRIYQYDAARGKMAEVPLSEMKLSSTDELRLLRLTDQGLLWVTQDRRLSSYKATHQEELGFGGFPFPPNEATAIAEAGSDTSLLVAGPNGRIVDYNWRKGTVTACGQLPQTDDPITQIHPSKHIKLAKTASGAVYSQTRANPWEPLLGWNDWAAEGNEIWALGNRGVATLAIHEDTELAKSLGPMYSMTDGFSSFCQEAVYAWQPTPTQLMIFRQDGRYGTYDADTDNWQEVSTRLPRVRQFLRASEPNRLFTVCAGGIHQIFPNGQSPVVVQIPANAKSVSAQIVDGHLQYAVLEESQLILKSLSLQGLNGELKAGIHQIREWKRARAVAPFEFSPHEVVLATPAATKTAVMLVDRKGSVAVYDFQSGQWSSWFRSPVENRLESWLTWPNGNLRLLIRQPNEKYQAIDIVKGLVVPRNDPAVPPAESLADETRKAKSLAAASKWFRAAAAEMPWLQTALTPAEGKFERLSKQQQPYLRTPDSPTRLNTDLIDISYTSSGPLHRYRLGADRWETFTFLQNMFDVDDLSSVYLTPTGELLAMTNGQIRPLEISSQTGSLLPGPKIIAPMLESDIRQLNTSITGQLEAQLADGRRLLFSYDKAEPLQILIDPPALNAGELAFGDWGLICRMSQQGIEFEWKKPQGAKVSAPPVWSGMGQELGTQRHLDIELDGQDQVLLSTESGLLVRDAKTYRVSAFYPEYANATLSRSRGANGRLEVIIQTKGTSAVWKEGTLMESRDGPAEIVVETTTGPWRWRTTKTSGPARLTIRHHSDQRLRRSLIVSLSSLEENLWRFCDDVVNWASRDPGNSERFWIATEDGLWNWDVLSGRSPSRPEELPGEAIERLRQYGDGQRAWRSTSGEWHDLPNRTAFESRCGHRALSITSLEGQLVMEAFDQGEVFLGNRFFFDQIDDMAALESRLFTRTQSRGLFARDPNIPGLIFEAWADPVMEIPPDQLAMHVEQQHIVLAGSPAMPRPGLRWKLNPSTLGASWEQEADDPWQPDAQIGPIAFLPDEQQPDLLVPFRVAEFEDTAPVPGQNVQPAIREKLENWWIGGRFSWDVWHDVAILPDYSIIGASAAGIVRLQPRNRTGDLLTGLEPLPGTFDVVPARAEAQQVGLLVRSDTGDWLLDIDASGNLLFETLPADHSLDRRAILALERADEDLPKNKPRILFHEEWLDVQKAGSQPALQSRWDVLPQHQLIQQGEWAFDRGITAAREFAPERAQASTAESWFTVCELESGESLLVESVLQLDSAVRLPQFRLQDVSRVSRKPTHLRMLLAGRISGLIADQPRLGQIKGSVLKWQEPDEDLLEHYRTGDRLELHTKPLHWSHRPESVVDRHANRSAITTPAGVELFTTTNALGTRGIQFSFDSFTRLICREDTQEFAVLTMAGLLVGFSEADGSEAHAGFHLDPAFPRIAPDSALRLNWGDSPRPVPWDPFQQVEQSLGGSLSRVRDSRGVPISRDPFGFGRRPLVRLAAYGRTDAATQATVSMSEGLFLLREPLFSQWELPLATTAETR